MISRTSDNISEQEVKVEALLSSKICCILVLSNQGASKALLVLLSVSSSCPRIYVVYCLERTMAGVFDDAATTRGSCHTSINKGMGKMNFLLCKSGSSVIQMFLYVSTIYFT